MLCKIKTMEPKQNLDMSRRCYSIKGENPRVTHLTALQDQGYGDRYIEKLKSQLWEAMFKGRRIICRPDTLETKLMAKIRWEVKGDELTWDILHQKEEVEISDRSANISDSYSAQKGPSYVRGTSPTAPNMDNMLHRHNPHAFSHSSYLW